MYARIIDTGRECIGGTRETEGRHESPIASPPNAQSMGVDVLSASQISDGAAQVIELAAAAGAAARVDWPFQAALREEVLVKWVNPALRTREGEPQQHLSLRAPVQEQN